MERQSAFDAPPIDAPALDAPLSTPPAPQPRSRPRSRALPTALGGQSSRAPAFRSSSGWVPTSEPHPELDESTARARSAGAWRSVKLAESMMIIHERSRGSLKSHSVRVARLSYSLCRQLDLSEPQAAHAWAIGLFHDLGKSQQHHLTALNVWQLQDHEVTAGPSTRTRAAC